MTRDEGTSQNPGKAQADYELRREELALGRQELLARIEEERSTRWIRAPLTVALATAVFGLLGTGVGAVLQGYWNTRLEHQKFEASLIQAALKSGNKNSASKSLLFFVDSGLIQSLDRNKIASLAKEPDRLPIAHQAVRAGFISITDAKRILKKAGIFDGPLDEADDEIFQTAPQTFQNESKLKPGGVLSVKTAAKLRALEKQKKC